MKNLTNVDTKELKEIYDDALKPTLKETGKVTALLPRAIKNALSKVEMWCLNKEFIVEEFKIELEQKLKNRKSGNVVDADPRVFVPTLQALSYSFDEREIKNLYLNLMASDMNSKYKKKVHPGFSLVIQQMDAVDVKLFTMLYNNQVLPVCELSEKGNKDSFNCLVEYILPDQFYSIAPTHDILNSLNNLERLELIKISMVEYYSDKSYYESIENGNLVLEYKKEYEDDLDLAYGLIKKTQFGKNFYDVCCK